MLGSFIQCDVKIRVKSLSEPSVTASDAFSAIKSHKPKDTGFKMTQNRKKAANFPIGHVKTSHFRFKNCPTDG